MSSSSSACNIAAKSNRKSERVNKNCAECLRGPRGRSMSVTARPRLFLLGGMNQLVLFVAGPTPSLLPIWLQLTGIKQHLYRLYSHRSNAHMLTLLRNYQPFYSNTPSTHMHRLWRELLAQCQIHYITHHAAASAFTSIDDRAIVVEDYSALVQSRNCVEEVEGPQIPLKLQLRTISFFLICIK